MSFYTRAKCSEFWGPSTLRSPHLPPGLNQLMLIATPSISILVKSDANANFTFPVRFGACVTWTNYEAWFISGDPKFNQDIFDKIIRRGFIGAHYQGVLFGHGLWTFWQPCAWARDLWESGGKFWASFHQFDWFFFDCLASAASSLFGSKGNSAVGWEATSVWRC